MICVYTCSSVVCAHASKDVFEYLDEPPTSNVTPCLRYLSIPFKDRYTPSAWTLKILHFAYSALMGFL